MINVTKTFLPPQAEYEAILKRAWDTGWITNRGQLLLELETKIQQLLGVKNVIAMTNGTLPIQIAIKALGLTGEIITTPFSYVATTSSIVWEGCTPVFVDIDPEYLTIDETKIEAAITERTTGILATHVYGNPCNVEVIEQIAVKHNLKVIYDAAHCFGVQYKGQSIFNYGDISTCSFHATKIFHTGEGGAAFCNNNTYDSVFFRHNFGHDGPDKFKYIGINAKMTELQAALGLAVIGYMPRIIESRIKSVQTYKRNLSIGRTFKLRDYTVWNGSYFPLILDDEEQLNSVVYLLNKNNIFPRRYFFPSLNNLFELTDQICPISSSIAQRVLCLPLYHDLDKNDQNLIIKIINKFT
ncbi:MAG: dTDP-4-amino-4,6-dideoxygalactose transaminase [Psychroserpens sp.]|jgi:dTDP-4-amino-4,6-dideoxygalactose transaminase